MTILGISAFYHNAAAALICNGNIIAAAQEERFTRSKHDERFPVNAIDFCLAEARVHADKIDCIAFYDNPVRKFGHKKDENFSDTPHSAQERVHTPLWIKENIPIPSYIENALLSFGYNDNSTILFSEHHLSHAASAFYPSPFDSAAILTIDGVGEWATSAIGCGKGTHIDILYELPFPHSLSVLYSAFTFFCGFKVNSGEYKLMGLAPYGNPVYVDHIKDSLIDLREDGSFKLHQEYFSFSHGVVETNNLFAELFGGERRIPESEITQREMDLARSIQVVTEESVIRMARHAQQITGEKNLCMAGSVALNCVANAKLLRENIFDNIWIQPAAGDAGGALGAALAVWYHHHPQKRHMDGIHDAMKGSFLGPSFSTRSIENFLNKHNYPYQKIEDRKQRAEKIAECIEQQHVIGLFQGRMEFGPRALGNRSIIGDPRSPDMQSIMNKKIKFRESFRPFAPSVLEERATDYFDINTPSLYMLYVADVQEQRRLHLHSVDESLHTRIHTPHSDIPAVTHVDYSARVHTVDEQTNPEFYAIIKAFEKKTGCSVLINTSFNVRGEPIVCTPEDAYKCFMRTQMDTLVLDTCILTKNEQPDWIEDINWEDEFPLD